MDPPATSKSPLIGSGIGLVPPEAPVKPLEFKPPIEPLDPKVVLTRTEIPLHSKLGTSMDTVRGESSGTALLPQRELLRRDSGTSRGTHSDVQPDSSDVESSDSELEEGEFSTHEPDFEVVRNKKRFSGQKGKRGRGPKIN